MAERTRMTNLPGEKGWGKLGGKKRKNVFIPPARGLGKTKCRKKGTETLVLLKRQWGEGKEGRH